MYKTGKVVISGIDTATLPNLKSVELEELLSKVKSGDLKARDQFIYSNLRLVLSVCKRFSGKKESIDDIFQVGIIGLVKSVDNFDPKFNVRFSTYAVPMIIGEIKRFLRDSSSIRVSRSLRDVAYQALLARDKLRLEKGTEPTTVEIASELKLDLALVCSALDSTIDPISLSDSAYCNSNGDLLTIIDRVEDEKQSSENILNKLCLNTALTKLNIREKEIINLRYFQGKTQIEVSEEVGISQAQVSRLEKNALKFLQQYV